MFVPVTAALHCTDGPCGHVTHVLVEAARMRLLHLAVLEPGVWPVERLIPVTLIGHSTSSVVVLSCTRAALEWMIARAEVDTGSTQARSGGGYLQDLGWSLVFPEETSLAVPRELVPPGEVTLHKDSSVHASLV